MHVDVLAIGAHPDDVELSCGGTVAKLVATGHAVGLAELTEGELGTRGTRRIRRRESDEAARILGAATRRNLRIPDGGIELSDANLKKVITLIRELRPRFLLIPHHHERHPDHVHAHLLCREAWFYAGLEKIRTRWKGRRQEPYRPFMYFCYMQKFEFTPSFIVDVSGYFEVRMASVRAHASQFHNPASRDRATVLSQPEFLEMIETRAKYFGQLIGVQHGEPFYSPVPVGVGSLFDLKLSGG